MARLKIVKTPNEILRKRSKEVSDFSSRLHQLLDDMCDTMHTEDGVGIAAVQVGILFRAVLVATSDGIIELINPVIIRQENPKSGDEGCLSVPDIRGKVQRPHDLTVCFYDRHGKEQVRDFHGRDAVCVCHEIDHLDGILFTDKLIV